MKKFLVPPLFLFLLLSCSDDDFAPKTTSVYCQIDNECSLISRDLCTEIGGTERARCPSSPSNDISSSSDEVSGSSSSDVGESSSSYVGGSSSSNVSSSSSSDVGSSSSSNVSGSSSSDVGASSGSDVSASSGSDVSASSGSEVSSSSIDGLSSSSSSLGAPSLGNCSTFPSYVAKQKESLNGLVPVVNNYDRCEAVTYALSGNNNNITITNTHDSINFTNYSSSGIRPLPLTLNITASVTCPGFTVSPKTCQVPIEVVADKFAKIDECDSPKVNVGTGSTVVEINCIKDETPAKHFGCDKPDGSSEFTQANVFTLNGIKAGAGSWPNGWAYIDIPTGIADKESKRVLIEYNVGVMKCTAY